jgi:hypothetical protein
VSFRCVRTSLLKFRHDRVKVEARRLLPHRKVLETRQSLCGEDLHRYLHEGAINHPFVIEDGFVAALERVGAQVE